MSQGPIRHVVIIVKENHSFDNYFGRFPGADGDATLAHSPNPPPRDPPHDHAAWLRRATGAARQQYFEADIPGYWSYARQFTLCDRYFTEVAGPSTPNHLMLITADSPLIDNPHGSTPAFNLPSLPAQLVTAGLQWRNYNGYAFDFVTDLKGHKLTSQQFAIDARAGNLPAVSWVYADHLLSEHPVDDVTKGMQWTVQQVQAVVAGGLWPSVAIFITWDDWGGWADHVVPPLAEKWKDGTQFRYGTRVGCLVLSPYAKKGYISKVQHSHVSLVALCEKTFGLPSLNARTAASDAMADCFDFHQAPQPPPV